MNDYPDTWLLIPVYNEEKVITEVLRNAQRTFPNIVCVDDGSSDASAERIRELGVTLVCHPTNLGQGAALQTAIEFARRQHQARYFVTYDSDGQHRIIDAERLVGRLRRGASDIVFGTRFSGGQSRVPWLKRLLLKTAVRLNPWLRAMRLSDTHNGLRAFNTAVAGQIKLRQSGMGHASEFIALAYRNNWAVAEEPITVQYTSYSMAKGQPLLNGVNILFDAVLHASVRRSP